MTTTTTRARALPACMGGWCSIRESCACYKSPHDRNEPAERLCPRGLDGEAFRPLIVRRIELRNTAA